MSPLERPAVNAWWQLAQSDLRVAQVVAGLDPAEWHLVCFLAQQAGEKSLKALLEFRHLAVPRSHDLVLLLDLLRDAPQTESLETDAAVLSAYGVLPRYPSPEFSASGVDATEALESARRIVAWAARELGVAPAGA